MMLSFVFVFWVPSGSMSVILEIRQTSAETFRTEKHTGCQMIKSPRGKKKNKYFWLDLLVSSWKVLPQFLSQFDHFIESFQATPWGPAPREEWAGVSCKLSSVYLNLHVCRWTAVAENWQALETWRGCTALGRGWVWMAQRQRQTPISPWKSSDKRKQIRKSLRGNKQSLHTTESSRFFFQRWKTLGSSCH